MNLPSGELRFRREGRTLRHSPVKDEAKTREGTMFPVLAVIVIVGLLALVFYLDKAGASQ
jgi:hypothetical protein